MPADTKIGQKPTASPHPKIAPIQRRRHTNSRSTLAAQESLLDLQDFRFSGEEISGRPHLAEQGGTGGHPRQWLSYSFAPLSVMDQIHPISEEWVADKGIPEMGFTFGGLDEINDPDVRCLLAINAQYYVHAITCWLRVYRDGAVAGWTLDFLRRRSTGFQAAFEVLIVSAALFLQDQG